MELLLIPDLVLINANIVTMDGLSPGAQAMAVRGGHVVALGTSAEMLALAGPDTRTLDARGRMVLPGLQDAHLHLQDSGYYNGTMADLTGVTTLEALKSRLAAHAAAHPEGWVFGVGWYTGVFSEDNLSGADLDEVTGDRPCLIYSTDLHSACLNSAGCAAVGLVAGLEPPPNGRFSLDAEGKPTGMVHEEAIWWVQAQMAPPTDADYIRGVHYGQRLANSHGITGIIDASVNERHARVYGAMAEAGSLTLRIAGAAKIDASESVDGALERLSALRRRHGAGLFILHSAKFFLDGVMENRTAAMVEGYKDAPGGNAPLMFAPEVIKAMFAAFDAARFQIHVHVIGDLAARAALDGLEHARAVNGAWPGLHQLTHLQFLQPQDIPRLGELGCVANIQTLWARHAPSTEVAAAMAGPELAALMYPFRALIDGGAHWTLTSDWGVSTLNPFQIMETATTRQPPGKPDHPVFLPEQRLTRAEALQGYTTHAAAATWRPRTGRLAPGSCADFIIIDRDILTCPAHEIGATQVLATYLAGEEVYRHETQAL